MPKLALCIDFDGVIHEYTSPWIAAHVISDNVVPGFFEWADEAAQHFTLVIYSARSSDPVARRAIAEWLAVQRNKWESSGGRSPTGIPATFQFADKKPKAFLYIDDRALRFDGDWSKLPVDSLRRFKPWNRKEAP